jgi:hypothetical protein
MATTSSKVSKLGLAVVLRVGRTQLRQPLAGPQGLDLGQGEVFGEPAGDLLAVDGLGRLAVGELGAAGDVGGAADLVLVAGDQVAVLGRHQVGLDEVAALVDGQVVGQLGVLRPQARGAAVGDDDGLLRRAGEARAGSQGSGQGGGGQGMRGEGASGQQGHGGHLARRCDGLTSPGPAERPNDRFFRCIRGARRAVAAERPVPV